MPAHTPLITPTTSKPFVNGRVLGAERRELADKLNISSTRATTKGAHRHPIIAHHPPDQTIPVPRVIPPNTCVCHHAQHTFGDIWQVWSKRAARTNSAAVQGSGWRRADRATCLRHPAARAAVCEGIGGDCGDRSTTLPIRAAGGGLGAVLRVQERGSVGCLRHETGWACPAHHTQTVCPSGIAHPLTPCPKSASRFWVIHRRTRPTLSFLPCVYFLTMSCPCSANSFPDIPDTSCTKSRA